MMFDCFMFFNENDLLEVRLNQHWDQVDKFIIVEASETHTGLKKPLLFDHDRFAKYKEKIVYRSIGSFEEEMSKNPNLTSPILDSVFGSQPQLHKDDWMRDNFQAEYLTKVLFEQNPNDSDLVIFSCLDEIFNLELALDYYVEKFVKDKRPLHSKLLNKTIPRECDPVFGFMTDLYAYKFNLYSKQVCVGLMTSIKNIRSYKHTDLRTLGFSTHEPLENAGWHFTFLDDSDGEKLLSKYKSWAHSRDVAAGRERYFEIETKARAIESVFRDYNLKEVDITKKTHPKYLVENLSSYSKYIYQPYE